MGVTPSAGFAEDIMDQGTDAATMLRGEDVPLRLGYVGVKMRSQQDILNKKPVKDRSHQGVGQLFRS